MKHQASVQAVETKLSVDERFGDRRVGIVLIASVSVTPHATGLTSALEVGTAATANFRFGASPRTAVASSCRRSAWRAGRS